MDGQPTIDDLFKALDWRNPDAIQVLKFRSDTVCVQTYEQKGWNKYKILEFEADSIEEAIEEAEKQKKQIEAEENE